MASAGTCRAAVFFRVKETGAVPTGHDACWYKELAFCSEMSLDRAMCFIVSERMTMVFGVMPVNWMSVAPALTISRRCPCKTTMTGVRGGTLVFRSVVFRALRVLLSNLKAKLDSFARDGVEAPACAEDAPPAGGGGAAAVAADAALGGGGAAGGVASGGGEAALGGGGEVVVVGSEA